MERVGQAVEDTDANNDKSVPRWAVYLFDLLVVYRENGSFARGKAAERVSKRH